MESEVLVIGHRNPDIDSIASAIGYAEFKRRTGLPSAVAARCGAVTKRAALVLDMFGFKPPRHVVDVAPKVQDVMEREVLHLSSENTLMDALRLMDNHNVRVLPILDSNRICQGFVSVFKMTKCLCPAPDQLDTRRILASLRNLAATLGAELLDNNAPDQEEEFILLVAAMDLETFSRRLLEFPADRLAVIVSNRAEIQSAAIQAGVRALIVTGGNTVPEEIVTGARQSGTSILLSPRDTATTAHYCRAALTLRHVLHEHFLTFREDDLIEQAERLAIDSPYHSFPVLDPQQRTVGILSKSDFLKKTQRRLILVDHNELSQAVPGAEKVEILEIIDHHRIGSLTTSHPIVFRNEPVGSTSSLVAELFVANQLPMSKNMAGLLLAGVISDTLNLTSPTTTERDRKIAQRLEQLSGVQGGELTKKIFASHSVLESHPPEEAIQVDCKEFREQGHLFSIAQIEEIDFSRFLWRKCELLQALEHHRRQKGYSFAALLVTDVLQQNSLLALAGSPPLAGRIDFPQLEPGIFQLDGIVSRKKQLLPYLTARIEPSSGRSSVMQEPMTMV